LHGLRHFGEEFACEFALDSSIWKLIKTRITRKVPVRAVMMSTSFELKDWSIIFCVSSALFTNTT
jgi:hypothetical protein